MLKYWFPVTPPPLRAECITPEHGLQVYRRPAGRQISSSTAAFDSHSEVSFNLKLHREQQHRSGRNQLEKDFSFPEKLFSFDQDGVRLSSGIWCEESGK